MSVYYPTPPGAFSGRSFVARLRADATRRVASRMSDWAQRQISQRMQRNQGRMFAEADQDRKRKTPKSQPEVSQENNMSAKYSVVNAQSNRASVQKKGRVKLRAVKKIKVSKNLRQKVEKVIAGENAYGEYYRRYGGMIGMIDFRATVANSMPVFPMARDGSYVYQMDNGPNARAGDKVWFAGLFTNTGANLDKTAITGGQFCYFTPLKLLDAASVLWNGKTASIDWTTVTNNFSLSISSTTAAPQVGSSQFANAGGLELVVVNSYVTWRIKNVNQRSMKIKIYCCVPKMKYGDQGPLTALTTGPLQDVSGSTRSTLGAGNIAAGSNVERTIACHPNFEPKQNTQFNNMYKYEVTEILIKPGEEIQHHIQGPKNYKLDYAKLVNSGTSEVSSFYKECSRLCMVSCEVDTVFFSDTNFQSTGPIVTRAAATASNTLINPISIEIDEVYKLSCPGAAGFMTQAGAAGSFQALNMKVPRKVWVNFNGVLSSAQTYTSFNEENVAAGVAESSTN